MLSRRASSVGGRARSLATNQPMPAPTDGFEVAHTSVRNRSRVEHELALRPERSAQSPDAADGAPCATRRGAGVTGLTAGPVPYFYGRHATGLVDASQSD